MNNSIGDPMDNIKTAFELAERLSLMYYLTNRAKINLEGTINNMLQDGIDIELIKGYLIDILDNVEFIE